MLRIEDPEKARAVVPVGQNGQPVRVDAEGQFCANCHKTVAEHLFCFGCHAAVPKGPQPAAIAGSDSVGEDWHLAMVHGGKVDLPEVQQQGGE